MVRFGEKTHVKTRCSNSATVRFEARHFGVPMAMTSRIVAYAQDRSFTDVQVKGPFGSFRHVHSFEPERDGCLMIDQLTFRAPFGLIGRMVERLFLRVTSRP